jgi:hypothetical protein
MKRCARCGEEKPTSEFGWKNKAKGWLRSYCRPCLAENSREHCAANKPSYRARTMRRKRQQRANRSNFLVEYFKSHPCVDCGETDPLVLEFDHLRDKEFDIGHEFTSRPWHQVLAEIEKCDVACANCHRRRLRGEEAFSDSSSTARRAGFTRLAFADWNVLRSP